MHLIQDVLMSFLYYFSYKPLDFTLFWEGFEFLPNKNVYRHRLIFQRFKKKKTNKKTPQQIYHK